MKNKVFSTALFCILVSVIFLSCKKTIYPNYVPPNNTNNSSSTASLNQLFSGLQSTPQTISVIAGRDTVVYGANGTMLHFYQNSFKNIAGQTITSGVVYLKLIEMYKAGDMIRNRATTMANGQILQSGGQINITAYTTSGQQVFTNGYGIGFYRGKQNSSASMALFYGGTNNSDSVTVWTQSDTTQKGVKVKGTVSDSILTCYYYFDSCKNIGWANCDWFYSYSSPKVAVSIVLPDTSFNAHNTQLYLILPNIRPAGDTTHTYIAVLSNIGNDDFGLPIYVASSNTLNLMSENQTNIVPSGLQYKLAVIANKNGIFYYYGQSGTIPTNGLTSKVNLAQMQQSEIITQLQAL